MVKEGLNQKLNQYMIREDHCWLCKNCKKVMRSYGPYGYGHANGHYKNGRFTCIYKLPESKLFKWLAKT